MTVLRVRVCLPNLQDVAENLGTQNRGALQRCFKFSFCLLQQGQLTFDHAHQPILFLPWRD